MLLDNITLVIFSMQELIQNKCDFLKKNGINNDLFGILLALESLGLTLNKYREV
jgi:hypothetical protein